MTLAWPKVTVLVPVILFAVFAFIAASLQVMRGFSSESAGPIAGHLVRWQNAGPIGPSMGLSALKVPGGSSLSAGMTSDAIVTVLSTRHIRRR
jgi:hypothetical protein